MGEPYRPFLLFKRSALAYDILFKSRNSSNSFSVTSVRTPLTARLFVRSLLIWKAFGRLILTFLPREAFILFLFCNIVTSCSESPILLEITFWEFLDR